MYFQRGYYRAYEGQDMPVRIGVVAEGYHPGESFTINVSPVDGTAKRKCYTAYQQHFVGHK